MQPKLFLTRLILALVCLSLFYLSCSYYLAAFSVDSGSKSNEIDDNTDEIVPKGLYERLKQEWDENVQIVNPKQTGNPCDIRKMNLENHNLFIIQFKFFIHFLCRKSAPIPQRCRLKLSLVQRISSVQEYVSTALI